MTQPLTQITEFDIDNTALKPTRPPATPPNRAKRFYLPKSLVLTAILLIITNSFVVLINQPTIYWIDYESAVSTSPIIHELLIISPFVFMGVVFAYVILAWLALIFLPRSPALAVWMILFFIHMRDFIGWVNCGVRGIYFNESNKLVCQVTNISLAIVGSAIIGLVLAKALFRTKPLTTSEGKPASGATSRVSLTALVASLVWVLVLTVTLIRATYIPATGWQPIIVEAGPSARIDGEIVFDIKRGKAVLFGGSTGWVGGDKWISEGDTWEWDGISWEQKFPETNPPDRYSHAMVFDEVRGVTVLFGGKNQTGILKDTWEWDGENWVERFPQNIPPSRCCHQMYFDKQYGKVRIFGGYDGTLFYDDIWEWDGTNWQMVTPNTPSPIASGFSHAYDIERQQLTTLLVGFPEGMWLFQENRWSEPAFELEPLPRVSAAMAYDRKRGITIIFGGVKDNKFFNDTWILGEEWEEYHSPLEPSPRWGHNFFYDTLQERVVMFGGYDGVNMLNEMWVFIPEE